MKEIVFYLPDLGEGLAEAEIRHWHVTQDEKVSIDQLLLSVETAKALVDIPSPYDGTVKTILAKPGDKLKVGTPLICMLVNALSPHEGYTQKHDSDPLSTFKNMEKRSLTTPAQKKTLKALPSARQWAKQQHISLQEVLGTGPQGIITLADVKNHARLTAETAYSSNTPTPADMVIPLRGAMRTMSERMAISHQQVAPSTLMDNADIHHWKKSEDMTVRCLQALVYAAQVKPEINSHFYFEKKEKIQKKSIDIGLALDTPDGLYIPVIKKAQDLSSHQMRQEIEHFKHYAKHHSFPQSCFANPTLLLSNFGSIAGRYANLMVLPPTVATIGIGQCYDHIVMKNKTPDIHRTLPISLTIDHRAVTGGQAARFLQAFIQSLEK